MKFDQQPTRTEKVAVQHWQYHKYNRSMPGHPFVWVDAPDEYSASKEAVKNDGKIRSIWIITVTDYVDDEFVHMSIIPGAWEEKSQTLY